MMYQLKKQVRIKGESVTTKREEKGRIKEEKW